MSIQFKIHKLGALRDTSFEYKPFMIFSGDSGLGKSYAAFLSYYFLNSLMGEFALVPFIEDVSGKKASEINQLDRFSITITFKQYRDWLNRTVSRFIGYLIGNEGLEASLEIDFDVEKPDFVIGYETVKRSGERVLYTFLNDTSPVIHTSPRPNINHLGITCQTHLTLSLLGIGYQRNMLLPPARAALMGASISATNAIMSIGMYKEFVEILDVLLSASYEESKCPPYLMDTIEHILNGKLIRQEGRLYYLTDDGVRLPISAAASSVKELSPLFLLLQRYEASQLCVLIEEPEAHLHPRMQIEVAGLIVNALNMGASFQITTHSDYFMGRINDLLKLHYIKSNVSEDKFKGLCDQLGMDPGLTLDSQKLGAYYFIRREDGSVQIITQDAHRGIPFDSFSEVVNETTADSFKLDDFMEEHNL